VGCLQDGGGFLGRGIGSLSITSTNFTGNHAGRDGGGLSCQKCQELWLQSTSFAINTAGGMGGGAQCSGCAKVHVTDGSAFESCNAGSGAGLVLLGPTGGAVASTQGLIAIKDCTIRNNTAQSVHLPNFSESAVNGDDGGDSGSQGSHGRRLSAAGAQASSTTSISSGASVPGAIITPDLTHWLGTTAALDSTARTSSSRSSSYTTDGSKSIAMAESSSRGRGSSSGSSGRFTGGPSCSTPGAGGGLCVELKGTMEMTRVEIADNKALLGGRLLWVGHLLLMGRKFTCICLREGMVVPRRGQQENKKRVEHQVLLL
jgi:predicted outer membrane repeat protein